MFAKIKGYSKITFCRSCKARLRDQKEHENYCDKCWADYLKHVED